MENPVTLRCSDSEDKSCQLERRQACSVSLYQARVFTIPSATEAVICDTKYEVVGLFCDWAKSPTTVINPNNKYLMKEPWLSNTEAAWILGVRLESRDFEKFCMSAFIKNCAFSLFGPWKEIETYARDGSPLARFSNHWIACNVSLLEHVPLEYARLKAVELAKSVTQYTGDLRDLDKGHWYSSCGDQIGLLCKHHPIAKQQTVDETQQENQPQSRPAFSHRSSHQSTRLTYTDSVYVPSRYICGIRARKGTMYRLSSSLLFASCLCIDLGLCVEILVHN
ncbi:hypothetical protein FCULG_00007135 [Fusarium culmorum]|uniref:Uncharacterized protein n=1 Tax=Fusarium culmorum TaxID=5516 RepID=A0A2T4GUW6_FUSCU|nr:hypothetical protein FCULG_00007135 [Fusarium culmorum]